jgi:hypothetical protein
MEEIELALRELLVQSPIALEGRAAIGAQFDHG